MANARLSGGPSSARAINTITSRLPRRTAQHTDVPLVGGFSLVANARRDSDACFFFSLSLYGPRARARITNHGHGYLVRHDVPSSTMSRRLLLTEEPRSVLPEFSLYSARLVSVVARARREENERTRMIRVRGR